MKNNNEKTREKFSSRLGFILISAGCAIGLGNVYRFPVTTGAYGGGFFVLLYLIFLVLLGIPVMTAELAVGRASQKSIASSFDVLQKPKQKWGFMKYIGISGNYLLMMFYTIITGWMVIYFVKFLNGSLTKDTISVADLGNTFGGMVTNPVLNILVAVGVIVIGFLICALGLKNGVEKITKVMMVCLLALLVGIAIYSLTLSGAKEGLKFYLVPSISKMKETGFITILTSAMGQAFFTLSLGIGCIAIFGSYINKDRSLFGEAITITSLDTFVAVMAGLIVFPACFTFNNGQTADAGSVGASFLFTTLSSTFNSMGPVVGRIIGTLFFLFMIFAALSTVIAVFENIVSFWLDLTKLNRVQVCLINIGLLSLLMIPAALGNSVWSNIAIGGKGIMDMEDFAVSNILLPLGSLFYVLFCTHKFGWGIDKSFEEINTGNGIKMPKFMKFYMKWILPVITFAVFILSILSFFKVI